MSVSYHVPLADTVFLDSDFLIDTCGHHEACADKRELLTECLQCSLEELTRESKSKCDRSVRKRDDHRRESKEV